MDEIEHLKERINDLEAQVEVQNKVISSILDLIDKEPSIDSYIQPPEKTENGYKIYGPRLKSHKPKP